MRMKLNANRLMTWLLAALLMTGCIAQKQSKRLDPRKRIPCPQKDC